MYPLYSYIFPETITTDRQIRDDTDVKRRVNLALLRGWRSDVEIYRCRATIAQAPKYQAYLKEIGRLRDKYRGLILNGTFRDIDLVECSNPRIDYSVFTNGDKLAIVATQSHSKSVDVGFKVAGYDFEESDGLGKYSSEGAKDSASLSLGKDAVVVLLFKKN